MKITKKLFLLFVCAVLFALNCDVVAMEEEGEVVPQDRFVPMAVELTSGSTVQIDDKVRSEIKDFTKLLRDSIIRKYIVILPLGRYFCVGEESKKAIPLKNLDDLGFLKFDSEFLLRKKPGALKARLKGKSSPGEIAAIVDGFYKAEIDQIRPMLEGATLRNEDYCGLLQKYAIKFVSAFKKRKEAQVIDSVDFLNVSCPVFFDKIKSVFPDLDLEVVKAVFKAYLLYAIDCKGYGYGYGQRGKLGWCPCKDARNETRFYSILHILNKVVRKNISKDGTFVFVSHGSGALLQEYLTLEGLVALGFRDIEAYLIDPKYSETTEESLEESGAGKAKEALRALRSLLSANIKIHVYTDYVDFLKQFRAGKKATILQMIDPIPDIWRVKQEVKNSREANYINFSLESNYLEGVYEKYGDDGFLNYEINLLLPYKGPLQTSLQNIPDSISRRLLSFGYRGYEDRERFVAFLKENEYFIKQEFVKNEKSEIDAYKGKIKLVIDEKQREKGLSTSDTERLSAEIKEYEREMDKEIPLEVFKVTMYNSQLYGFYELMNNVASQDTLIYQIDKNKIYTRKTKLFLEVRY